MFTPIITWAFCCSIVISSTDITVKDHSQYRLLPTEFNSDLVVTFEKYTPKQIGELTSALAQIQGLKIQGSCEKLRCYYFSYDTSVFADDAAAFEAITLRCKTFQPLLKAGTTVAEVQRACNN